MSNIVLLFGEDQFGIHEKIAYWKAAFIEKYGGDTNIDEFEGTTSPNEIIEAAEAMPFLADKRLILVKGFLEQQKADSQKIMTDRLDKIPESSTLVFVELKAPDKRTSLFKKLQKIARVEESKTLTGNTLVEWIVKKVKEQGSDIDWGTATHLSTLVGEDTWKAKNEVEKLAMHCQDKPITREHVDELVHGNISTTVFKLTDALGQRRPQEAVQMFHLLVEKGEPIPMIFSMLVRQFRMLLQLQDLQSSGHSSGQIASKTKLHPYAISQTLPQTKNFTDEELREIYSKLLKIDHDLKTGVFRYQTNDQREFMLQIEKFIIECCEAR